MIAFGVMAVVHLVLNGADASPWDSITKCFLAPLLAAWVIQQKGPRALVVALVFCFFGDLFLELGDSVFVVGMAAFAGAHITFIRFFVARGAVAQLRRKPLLLVVYVALAIGMVTYVWTGLDAGLRPVIPIYAALLVGTAATSLATDVRAGIGGLLFLISDGIIALGQADRIDNDATGTGWRSWRSTSCRSSSWPPASSIARRPRSPPERDSTARSALTAGRSSPRR